MSKHWHSSYNKVWNLDTFPDLVMQVEYSRQDFIQTIPWFKPNISPELYINPLLDVWGEKKLYIIHSSRVTMTKILTTQGWTLAFYKMAVTSRRMIKIHRIQLCGYLRFCCRRLISSRLALREFFFKTLHYQWVNYVLVESKWRVILARLAAADDASSRCERRAATRASRRRPPIRRRPPRALSLE